jgi:DNA (cytosine-5)-methyltransferase 1
MTHGSLFSGIGGFDLAAQWMGWENKFHCEWNEFGQKVLHHYWPNAELFTDITKSDFKKYYGTIDIISGGFPCQPYSSAGKRLGKEDDRHLWPEMLRVIREVRPRWVVGENVFGLVNWSGGLVFQEVQSDLEAEGYEVQPYVLPAAAVGAPHRRDRVWFVAHANGIRGTQVERRRDRESNEFNQITKNADASNPFCIRLEHGKETGNICESTTEAQNQGRKSAKPIKAIGSNGYATDTNGKMLEHGDRQRQTAWATQQKVRIKPSCSAGLPQWQAFPTVSPICSRNDGISNQLDGITFSKWRNESIKAFGNAVVPQVVYQIFMAIETYEKLYNERGK